MIIEISEKRFGGFRAFHAPFVLAVNNSVQLYIKINLLLC